MKKNFIVGGALLSLFLAGCEGQTAKEVNPEAAVSEKTYHNLVSLPKNTDADMEIFARSLAKAMDNPSLRAFIKKEAMKQFDGDYDILLKNAAKQDVGYGKVLLELVAERSFASTGKTKSGFLTELQKIAAENPLFHIAIPVGIEGFNPAKDVPLVALLPSCYDEATAVSIKAFAQDGSIVWLDAKKDPEKAVIVIGINERVNAKGEVREGLISLPRQNNAAAQTGGASGAKQTTGYRVDGSMEMFEGATIASLKNIEDWAAGKPELEGWVKSGITHWAGSVDYNGYNEPTISMNPTRSAIDGRFYSFSKTLRKWNVAELGTNLLYVWNEADPSTGTKAHTITLPGFSSTSFITGGQDEWLGTATVAFGESLDTDRGYTYNTSGIECQWNNSCGFSFRVSATQVQ